MGAQFTASIIEATYLVELDVQPPTAGATSGETDFGDRPFAVEQQNDTIENVEAVYRWADHPFRSRPDDTPPNEKWDHRLLTPLELVRVLPLVPGGEGTGVISADLGVIELVNADKALDGLVRTSSVDGRDVVVKRVAPGAPYASAVTVFTGTAEGWAFAGRETVELAVRGRAHRLDGPLQSNLYAGTGGINGGPDIANRPKPLCYGKVRNMTPVCVDRDIQLYQVHDGSIEGIPAVRDGQVPLVQATDYPTLDDLINPTNEPAGGEYTTCLAEGHFLLGAVPEYDITADVWGDNTGGTFWTTTADIARRLALRGGVSSGMLDNDGIDLMAALQPAVIGYHVPASPVNAAAAIAEVLAGAGMFLIETPHGLYTIKRLEAPEPSADTVGDDAWLEFSLLDQPAEVKPAIWRIGVTYALNWTVQQIAIDAVNATKEQLDFVKQPSRVAIAFDTGIKNIRRMARDHVAAIPPVLGFFDEEADAKAEAERLLALWGVPRQLLLMPVPATGLDKDIGDSLTVFADRYGMEAGAPCRVYGTAFSARDKTLSLYLLR